MMLIKYGPVVDMQSSDVHCCVLVPAFAQCLTSCLVAHTPARADDVCEATAMFSVPVVQLQQVCLTAAGGKQAESPVVQEHCRECRKG